MPDQIRKATPEELGLLGGSGESEQYPHDTTPPGGYAGGHVRPAQPHELSALHADTQPQPQPSFLERLGGWRGLTATGVRAGAGILGAEGLWPGAAINAAGETAAEMIEGSSPSAARIGTEAAIGAVPFGKIIKAGKIGTSMIRSGTMGAVGEGMRETAQGRELDPSAIATSGGLGALIGAAGSKWAGRTPRVKPEEFDIVPTAHTGPGTMQLVGTKTNKPGTSKVIPSAPIPSITGEGIPEDAIPMRPWQEKGQPVPYGLGEPAAPAIENAGPTPDVQTKEIMRDQKNLSAVQKWLSGKRDTAAKVADKASKEAAAADEIARIREGMVEQGASSSDSFAAPIEGGTQRASIKYGLPEMDEAAADEAATAATGGAPRAPRPPATPAPAAELNPKVAQVPPEGTKARGIYDSWRELGRDHKTAYNLASKGLEPTEAALAKAAPAAPEVAAEIPPTVDQSTEAPQSALAKFFKTRSGAAGYNYRLAKEAEASGEIPTSTYARDARLRESPPKASNVKAPSEVEQAISGHVTPEPIPPTVGEKGGIVKKVAAPTDVEPQPYVPSNATETPGVHPMSPQEIQDEHNFIETLRKNPDLLKKLVKEETGAASNAALLKIGGPVAGALVGGPIGASYDPEDPGGGAIKGAVAGGLIGHAATGGTQQLINLRNAGLLFGPAQLKKPLSDLGAYLGLIGEKAFQGGEGTKTASRLVKEGLRLPTQVSNYVKGWKNPELAGEVLGGFDVPQPGGLLKYATKPFAAAQYATQQAMERAGIGVDEARKQLMLGTPTTKLARDWVDLGRGSKVGRQIVNYVRPFPRIATNIAERGLERTPGISLMMGDPETRVARTVMGSGAVGAGVLTGESDTTNAEEGNPTNPMIKGLRRASLASYGLPFALGESIGGQSAMEIYNLLPGLRQTLPPPAPGDNIITWTKKLAAQGLDQLLPSWLMPDKGTAR